MRHDLKRREFLRKMCSSFYFNSNKTLLFIFFCLKISGRKDFIFRLVYTKTFIWKNVITHLMWIPNSFFHRSTWYTAVYLLYIKFVWITLFFFNCWFMSICLSYDFIYILIYRYWQSIDWLTLSPQGLIGSYHKRTKFSYLSRYRHLLDVVRYSVATT